MKQIQLKCRIITPLFMGGVNQQAELRSQSFNGVLRWWFRVAGGSFEDEKRLFGWGGNNAKKGLVSIHIHWNRDKELKGKSFNFQDEGLRYLSFSLRKREYIPEGEEFYIRFLFHPKATEEDIKKFLCVTWIAFNLGNFGSRSRRGFGSIKIEEIKNFPVNGFSLEFTPTYPIEAWIRKQLSKIRGLGFWTPRKDIPYIFSKEFKIYKINKENIKNLNNWVSDVQKNRHGKYLKNSWRQKPFNKAVYLLDFIGFLLMAFRSYRNPDYINAKNILAGRDKNIPVFERPIFGLPLGFYFSSIQRRDFIFGKKDGTTLRRASPLFIKILETSNGYEGLLIVAKSKFLHEDAELYLNNVKVSLPRNNEWKALDNFIESLEKHNLIRGIYP